MRRRTTGLGRATLLSIGPRPAGRTPPSAGPRAGALVLGVVLALLVPTVLFAGLGAVRNGPPVGGSASRPVLEGARGSNGSGGDLSVSIHNLMANATGAYQQPVTIDSSAFALWINSNWTNGRVYDSASGAPLNAWIESGASNNSSSTRLWVQMPSISAGGWANLTIAFGAKSSFDLSANGSMGEAPELSASYGQFDNGAKVFNFYDNFAGSSLGSAWEVHGGWNYTVDDGFTWNSTPGNGDGIVTSQQFTYPAVVDAYSNLFESNPAASYTGQGFGSGGCMICSPSNSSAVGWEAQTSLENGPAPWAAVNSTHENGTSVFATQRYAVFTTEAVDRSTALCYDDYQGRQTLTQGIPAGPVPVILAQTGLPAGPLTNSITTTWIRERTYVPQLPVPQVSGSPESTVTFAATGLPWGTSWTVSLGTQNATSTGPIGFLEPNGSYAYTIGSVAGFTAIPSSGTVHVSGSSVTVTVAFTSSSGGRSYYAVDFTETGLPSGATWAVTLNGSSKNATSGTLGFTEPNGSYSYTVSCGSSYTSSPSNGTAIVSGSIVAISIVCQNSTGGFWPLAFEASGLSSATSWSVTVSPSSSGLTVDATLGITRSASGDRSIDFRATPGTYSYTATAPGFGSESGTVTVSGAAAQKVAVRFVSSPAAPSSSATPLSPEVWAFGLAIFAIGALGLAATAFRSRARRLERGRRFVRRISETDWAKDESGEPLPRMNP